MAKPASSNESIEDRIGGDAEFLEATEDPTEITHGSISFDFLPCRDHWRYQGMVTSPRTA
jgi:hypothetical protein